MRTRRVEFGEEVDSANNEAYTAKKQHGQKQAAACDSEWAGLNCPAFGPFISHQFE
jgi:hypothetical protein